MCNIHWNIGITRRSNNEIYTQVNKPRVYYKSKICIYVCMHVYMNVFMYICTYVCVCVHTFNHHIISQEELRKVMSDSLSTAHVEVYTLALMYHVFDILDILVIILHQ